MENGGPVLLVDSVFITDPDGPTLHNASVTIEGVSCASQKEYLSVSTSGTDVVVSRDGPCLELMRYDTLENYAMVLMTLR